MSLNFFYFQKKLFSNLLYYKFSNLLHYKLCLCFIFIFRKEQKRAAEILLAFMNLTNEVFF